MSHLVVRRHVPGVGGHERLLGGHERLLGGAAEGGAGEGSPRAGAAAASAIAASGLVVCARAWRSSLKQSADAFAATAQAHLHPRPSLSFEEKANG